MENENGEQPFKELANVSGETVESGAASENGSLTASEQGQADLGKFKSAQALLDAYNNLQAEFTKKCQRLSELEKDKIAEDEKSGQTKQNLTLFLEKNAMADEYAGELQEKLASMNSSDVESAWAGVVLDHIKAGRTKEDKIVDKYVLGSENLRNALITSYLNSLKSMESPITISSSGQQVSSVTPDTASSLDQAKTIVEKMFS